MECHRLLNFGASQATFYEQDLSERICGNGALCPKPLLVDRTEDGELTICHLTHFRSYKLGTHSESYEVCRIIKRKVVVCMIFVS